MCISMSKQGKDYACWVRINGSLISSKETLSYFETAHLSGYSTEFPVLLQSEEEREQVLPLTG